MAAQPPSDSKLLEALREHGHQASAIEALRGDVSARRYFRVTMGSGGTAILAFYPPDLESTCVRFERTTRLLEQAAVPVPAILFTDPQAGLMLLQDLGPETLYSRARRSWRELTPYLEQAARLSCSIAGLATAPVADLNPPLDHELLTAELERTWKLLFADGEILAGDLPPRLRRALESMLDTLTAEPMVPCHRDFMARNLIPVGTSPALALIDHQDLRLGPASYDLASLLNDSLFAPVEVEDRLVAAALPEEHRLQYHRAAAQRTLKAVGTFLAFAKRGEHRHLPLIAPSLTSARRHLLELPECEAAQHDVRSLWSELGDALATSGPRNPIC